VRPSKKDVFVHRRTEMRGRTGTILHANRGGKQGAGALRNQPAVGTGGCSVEQGDRRVPRARPIHAAEEKIRSDRGTAYTFRIPWKALQRGVMTFYRAVLPSSWIREMVCVPLRSTEFKDRGDRPAIPRDAECPHSMASTKQSYRGRKSLTT